jgi:hypothetical protein
MRENDREKRMRLKRFTRLRGGVVAAVVMAPLALVLTAPTASAAVRGWSPDSYPAPAPASR